VGPGPPSREARTDKDLAPRRWYNSTFQLLLHNRPRITPLPSLSCRSAKLQAQGSGCSHCERRERHCLPKL
jgi:hypothetical protein